MAKSNHLIEEGKTTWSVFWRVVFYGALVLAVIGLLTIPQMFGKGFFGAWNEQIRFDIQQESEAYRLGVRNRLGEMHTDWANADSAGRAAVAARAVDEYQRLSNSHFNELPPYLQAWASELGAR